VLIVVVQTPKVEKGDETRGERRMSGCEGGKGMDWLAVVLYQ